MYILNLASDLISKATWPHRQEFNQACASNGGGWCWRYHEVSGSFFNCLLLVRVHAITDCCEELESIKQEFKPFDDEFSWDGESQSQDLAFLWEVALRKHALIEPHIDDKSDAIAFRQLKFKQSLWENPYSFELQRLMGCEVHRKSVGRILAQSIKTLDFHLRRANEAKRMAAKMWFEHPKRIRYLIRMANSNNVKHINGRYVDENYEGFIANLPKKTQQMLKWLNDDSDIDPEEIIHSVLTPKINALQEVSFPHQFRSSQTDEFRHISKSIERDAINMIEGERRKANKLGLLRSETGGEIPKATRVGIMSGERIPIVSLDEDMPEDEDTGSLYAVIPNPKAGDPSDVLELLFPEPMVLELEDVVGGKRWLRQIIGAFQEIVGDDFRSTFLEAVRGKFDVVTQRDIAEYIGRPKSTVNRYFNTLRRESDKIRSIYTKYFTV